MAVNCRARLHISLCTNKYAVSSSLSEVYIRALKELSKQKKCQRLLSDLIIGKLFKGSTAQNCFNKSNNAKDVTGRQQDWKTGTVLLWADWDTTDACSLAGVLQPRHHTRLSKHLIILKTCAVSEATSGCVTITNLKGPVLSCCEVACQLPSDISLLERVNGRGLQKEDLVLTVSSSGGAFNTESKVY